jgi:hypothetical protein
MRERLEGRGWEEGRGSEEGGRQGGGRAEPRTMIVIFLLLC